MAQRTIMREVEGAGDEGGTLDIRPPALEDAPPLGRHRCAQIPDLPAEIEEPGLVLVIDIRVIDRRRHRTWHHLLTPCRSCDIRGNPRQSASLWPPPP